MKMRIKYMYEKGRQQLLKSTSGSPFALRALNRAEYVSKISEYDRKMLDQYVATKESIADSKKKLGDGEGGAAGDEDADGGKAGFGPASPE